MAELMFCFGFTVLVGREFSGIANFIINKNKATAKGVANKIYLYSL